MESLRPISLLAASALLFSPIVVRAGEFPTGVVTLRDALAAALQGHPTLAAAAHDVRAGEGRRVQRALLPNPTLAAEAENLGASADGGEPPQTTLRLAELVELGGKRAARERLAELEIEGARWEYQIRRASALADAARAFVNVLALQERVALTGDLIRLADDAERGVDAQVHAGAAAPVEASRSRVAAAQARLERAQRERELAAARLALAAAWGAERPTFDRVAGALGDVAAPPPLDLDAVSRNPDVARWTTEVAARAAAESVEHTRAVPDVTIAAGPRVFTDSGEVAAVLELAVALPIFDRNQGAIAAAAAEREGAAERQRAAALAGRAALGRALEALQAAYARAVTLRDELVPAAAAIVGETRRAYDRGAVRSLDVLDAQRTWFALRDEQLDACAAYHLARVDVERLAGGDLDRLDLEQEER